MSAPPDRISELHHSMQSCISDDKAWATANMLKLNDNKTELMLVTSKRSKYLHNLPTSQLFAAGSPTDTVGRQNFRTLSTRQAAFLVAEQPMPAMLL